MSEGYRRPVQPEFQVDGRLSTVEVCPGQRSERTYPESTLLLYLQSPWNHSPGLCLAALYPRPPSGPSVLWASGDSFPRPPPALGMLFLTAGPLGLVFFSV